MTNNRLFRYINDTTPEMIISIDDDRFKRFLKAIGFATKELQDEYKTIRDVETLDGFIDRVLSFKDTEYVKLEELYIQIWLCHRNEKKNLHASIAYERSKGHGRSNVKIAGYKRDFRVAYAVVFKALSDCGITRALRKQLEMQTKRVIS